MNTGNIYKHKKMELLHIGNGAMVVKDRVTIITIPDNVSSERLIRHRKEHNLLIDTCMRRKKRSVIIMDDGCIVLSCISPKTLGMRFEREAEIEVRNPELEELEEKRELEEDDVEHIENCEECEDNFNETEIEE